MEELFFKSLETLSIPGLVALIAYLCYKAGILSALSSWIKKDTQDHRVDKLEEFKTEAESNHWHDIEELKRWRNDLDHWKTNIEDKTSRIAEDVAFMKGKMNGLLK